MENVALSLSPASTHPSARAHHLRPSPRTLDHVIEDLRATEAAELPDAVTPLSSLTMTDTGAIAIPGGPEVAMNAWSRSQLASLLGLRWDRWFMDASGPERAEEINRRLARAGGQEVRLRTTRSAPDATDGPLADGTLTAIVTPSYTPISDLAVATTLREALVGIEDEMRIVRSFSTEMTTSFVLRVGKPFRRGGPGEVGDLWGCLSVRNSGVGYASLSITAFLHRLACLNGMVVPLPDASLLSVRHRGLTIDTVKEKLAFGLNGIGPKLLRGADVLASSGAVAVADIETEVRALLVHARLPLRLTAPIMAAYGREPHASQFGVSQAVTLAAQGFSPEVRYDLERAAGAYLAHGGIA